jgi:hypothetical protein
MIPEDMWKETTGYGISTTEMGDTHTMIVVDDDARTVEVKLRDYEGDFPTSGDRPWLSGAVMPYETFIREQIVETATRLRHQVVQRPVTRC